MAELSYHNHPMEVQLEIARFTWFMLYLDDLRNKFPDSLQILQQCVMLNNHMDEPVAQHFRKHLNDLHNFWDSAPANGIISAAMEFINGCDPQDIPQLRDMKLSVNARSQPYFLQAKTGVAEAYAFMIFPQCTNPELSEFIQAIRDISLFIDLTNDLLSFYKDEPTRETKTYVRNMAYTDEQPVSDTLNNILREALDVQDRVNRSLHVAESFNQWKTFINGYVAFHMTQKRYRLDKLGWI